MQESGTQHTRRRIEVFSAGCATCDDTVEFVRELAGEAHELHIHNMQEAEVARRAKSLGVHSLPAVVIDGKLAGCCSGRGPNEATIRKELALKRPIR